MTSSSYKNRTKLFLVRGMLLTLAVLQAVILVLASASSSTGSTTDYQFKILHPRRRQVRALQQHLFKNVQLERSWMDPQVDEESVTSGPTSNPTSNPTNSPTVLPTLNPTLKPTNFPTFGPVLPRTDQPSTQNPTSSPTTSPTRNPTSGPTNNPTSNPTESLSVQTTPSTTTATTLQQPPPPIDLPIDDDEAPPSNKVRVVIVGAGAAGLGAARELERNGILDYIILEADSKIGGRTQKDTTFVGYPLDIGASFVDNGFSNELSRIAGEPLPYRSVPGLARVFRNYTFWDAFQDYLKPADNRIELNCQVNRLDYRRDRVRINCADGRLFVADRVVVTVPLSILESEDIFFNPALDPLSSNQRRWWGGFKIFIEFDRKFYGDYFCLGDCYMKNGAGENSGENLFWDYTYSAPDRSSASHLLAGYMVGEKAQFPFFEWTDEEIKDYVLERIMREFNIGNPSALGYRRHRIVNWSKNSFVRGTYSSGCFGRCRKGINVVEDRLFFAGEAFPVGGDERGWVHSALHSGIDAAKRIADLPVITTPAASSKPKALPRTSTSDDFSVRTWMSTVNQHSSARARTPRPWLVAIAGACFWIM